MKKIAWDERFSVGVIALDEQHRQLIAMINRLIDNEEASASSEPITEVLDRMTKYAGYHFRTEERLMIDYGYPEYASHERDHTEFKARTAKFCMEAIHHQKALGHELLAYLSSWLTNHILESDMKYKAFFREKGLR